MKKVVDKNYDIIDQYWLRQVCLFMELFVMVNLFNF